MTISLAAELLLLMLAANGAPVVAARLLGEHADWPVDGGRLMRDGRRLFGASKTWRGLVAGLLACAVVGTFTRLGAPLAILFGAASLCGDLLSSWIKRRLAIPSSGRAVGLDQIPEALLPLLFFRPVFGLSWMAVALLVLLFLCGSLLISRLAFRLGIKRQPW